MTYLQQGAVGVFGASTVAYGPSSSNAYADVICRMFMAEVLGGASLGRAALLARQQFVQSQSFLDPTDLKTLAQFNLLGDPAAVPFVLAAHKTSAKTVPTPATSAAVLMRRTQLASVGAALSHSTYACADTPRRRAGLSAQALRDLLGRGVPDATTIRTFEATPPAAHAAMHHVRLAPRAHVAYLPRSGRRPPSLVVVREAGAEPLVRVLERK
jgi:hypothetical protein